MTDAVRHEPRLARFLRSGALAWPSAPEREGPALLEAARAHRLVPLLQAASARGDLPGWPAWAAEALARGARLEAARDLRRQVALRRVLSAFAEAGIVAVVFKGAALAHTLYDSPELRPRADTDLLVAEGDVAAAERCLARLGYRRGPRIRGRVLESQAPWLRSEAPGFSMILDLHWRISNRQCLAPRFPFEALLERSRPCPALGPGARIPDAADALLIAAVHGPAHHGGSFQPLLWRWDVHLLARSLDASGRKELRGRSHARGVTGLLAAALEDAAERFGTPRVDRLPGPGGRRSAPPQEASAELLVRAGRGLFLHDLRHAPGLGDRLRLLREAALPDTDYLRWRHGEGRALSRPRLLVRRMRHGARRALGAEPAP